MKENINLADFPTFDSMICSEDIYELFTHKLPKRFMTIFGFKVIKLDVMPVNTAMFLDAQGNPVALLKDGMIAFPGKLGDGKGAGKNKEG